ncbi:hypothetical protein AGR7A_Lc10036 [Agrobacterium deltaense NCPPB 1641]|uniref:Uncharacterized protein n=1 Tax=Agrobacterium deltaense NCPPB 1641 TaxID=1183425 RepID=A0A1S7TS36_9HYPH|nr:hypothetical protein AGR7A_Lc10036 [Agrobacterium deltaense NCPPB 1641]
MSAISRIILIGRVHITVAPN